jgi:hypothetical protein
MGRTNLISAIIGLVVAAGVFIAAQKWDPPDKMLALLDAAPSRRPGPERPFHTVAVRPEPAQGDPITMTEADVYAARARPAQDGAAGVVLELTASGRDKLAAFAGKHAADTIAVTVDGTAIYTKPGTAFTGDGAKTIDLPSAPPLEDPNRLAARFGGAPVPAPGYAIQAARLVPALIAGILVLALVRLLTKR